MIRVGLLCVVVVAMIATAAAASGNQRLPAKNVGLTDFYPVCDQVTLLGYPCVHSVPTVDGSC